MHTVLDINGWEQTVAESEAVLLRESVRGALASGAGLQATLDMVRRRMRSLTPAQREIVVAAIDAPRR
ncbi:MAG TPA: hypothetical protein VL422_08355 [Miltoncostaea sp.]|nr:hypothetical protein [Miltoncostaea sp.]